MYSGYARDKAAMAANGIGGRKEIVKNEGNDNARVVAVDWAVGKDRWQEIKAEYAPKDASNGEGSEAQAEEASGDESDGTSQDNSASSLDIERDDSATVDDEKSGPPQPEEGTTLFIRNVPFEATDEDLKEL